MITKTVAATMDSSSYIGDVIMIEEDTHEKENDFSCRVDDDVDSRIATLESEIASRQAELTRLKSSSVAKNSGRGHMTVNNYKDTAAAIKYLCSYSLSNDPYHSSSYIGEVIMIELGHMVALVGLYLGDDSHAR